jgi:hypothetical protein
VTSPIAATYRKNYNRTGSAAAARETAKSYHYSKQIKDFKNMNFVAFAVEAYGGIGDQGRSLITKAVRASSTRWPPASHLFERVSVALISDQLRQLKRCLMIIRSQTQPANIGRRRAGLLTRLPRRVQIWRPNTRTQTRVTPPAPLLPVVPKMVTRKNLCLPKDTSGDGPHQPGWYLKPTTRQSICLLKDTSGNPELPLPWRMTSKNTLIPTKPLPFSPRLSQFSLKIPC